VYATVATSTVIDTGVARLMPGEVIRIGVWHQTIAGNIGVVGGCETELPEAQ